MVVTGRARQDITFKRGKRGDIIPSNEQVDDLETEEKEEIKRIADEELKK